MNQTQQEISQLAIDMRYVQTNEVEQRLAANRAMLRDALAAEAAMSDAMHAIDADPYGERTCHPAHGHAINALHHLRMTIVLLQQDAVAIATRPILAESAPELDEF